MSEVKEIRFDIPIPENRGLGRPPVLISAILNLKVGDSFIYETPKSRNGQTSALSVIRRHRNDNKDCNIKIVTRKLNDTQVRIWRYE
jgi:hypothetical protein